MANIGEQLLQPEEGWQRIDDSNNKILFTGSWTASGGNNYHYCNTIHHLPSNTSSAACLSSRVKFRFYGTKLRLGGEVYNGYSKNIICKIDGQEYNYSEYAEQNISMVLYLDVKGLERKTHNVEIYCTDGIRYQFDYMDIDKDGYLIAQIGCQLTAPETGWQRIDDTDTRIKYIGNWILDDPRVANYLNTTHLTATKGDSYTFKFKGTQFRILSALNADHSESIIVNIDGVDYNYSENDSVLKRVIMVFESPLLKNTIHSITVINNESAYLGLDAIDINENGLLLTEEEYIAMLNRCFIKSNNKYYTIEENNLVEITEEITRDLIENRGVSVNTLATSQSILPDKFKLIYMNNNTVDIRGIKSNTQLIVASNNFSTKIADSIDYFKAVYEKNTNSSIKITFSIDNGTTWKGNNFENLDIEIPLKPYSELSEEERIKWNTAKETIDVNGIDIEDLESLDFNILNFEYIRFAYVLSIVSADDICNTSKLQWQFDAKGSMQLMDSTELDVEVLSNSIKITPKTEEELIKVNITNGTCSGLENPSQDESLTDEEINTLITNSFIKEGE